VGNHYGDINVRYSSNANYFRESNCIWSILDRSSDFCTNSGGFGPMNKKGLSDVLTTLLIILTAVAAVAIIGTIVLRNITADDDNATFCDKNPEDALYLRSGDLRRLQEFQQRTNEERNRFIIAEQFCILKNLTFEEKSHGEFFCLDIRDTYLKHRYTINQIQDLNGTLYLEEVHR
jgi:hypothetical protein